MLKPRGAMVSVGLPTEPDTFHAGSLIGRDRILSGSNVGGLPLTRRCSTSARSTASRRRSR